jgi:hypothetical protein
MRSESINELATAMAKAQGDISGAIKDSQNPFFKSSYADLGSVWDACRAPLSKNGLSVIQTIECSGSERWLKTTLAHSSGQWIESLVPINPTKDDPQGLGSCLTYLRRYSLAAIVGVYQEDDDGNAATKPAPARHSPPKGDVAAPAGVISEPMLKRLWAIANKSGYNDKTVHALLGTKNIQSVNALTRQDYDALCKYMEANPKQQDMGNLPE